MKNQINNLRGIDEGRNALEIIKTRLEKSEKDIETGTKTLRINNDEINGSAKKVLEGYITNCGYDIIGSTECFEGVKGDKTKGFYEFYVVKKEFAGVC